MANNDHLTTLQKLLRKSGLEAQAQTKHRPNHAQFQKLFEQGLQPYGSQARNTTSVKRARGLISPERELRLRTILDVLLVLGEPDPAANWRDYVDPVSTPSLAPSDGPGADQNALDHSGTLGKPESGHKIVLRRWALPSALVMAVAFLVASRLLQEEPTASAGGLAAIQRVTDDQIAQWGVGKRVVGSRNDGKASLEGVIVRSDSEGLVLEFVERWIGVDSGRAVSPRYRWFFERMAYDTATGACEMRLVEMLLIGPGNRKHRGDFDGRVTLKNKTLTGWATYSWLKQGERIYHDPTQPKPRLDVRLIE